MLVVNLIAGPGAGKSTLAAHVYALLKWDGQSVELVTEFAKDLTWEQRDIALRNQLYVLGKQVHRLERLEGKVDAVITDSPLALFLYYGNALPAPFHDLVRALWGRYVNMLYFVDRVKPYAPKGRNETEYRAHQADKALLTILDRESARYLRVPGIPESAGLIAAHVRARLRGRQIADAIPLAPRILGKLDE